MACFAARFSGPSPSEHAEELVDRLGDGEALPGTAPRDRVDDAERDRLAQSVGQRMRVVGRHQDEGTAARLRQSPVVGGDDTAARVLRLDRDDAEGLVPVLALEGIARTSCSAVSAAIDSATRLGRRAHRARP